MKMKIDKELDILYIDYLQLVDSESGNKNYNREQEVAKMSRGLKIMAMEYNIPIVILAQLNREAAKEKKPQSKNSLLLYKIYRLELLCSEKEYF